MTATKKFNWKKAVTIFFSVVVVLRILAWLFISPVPKCDDYKTTKLLNNIMQRSLKDPQYEGISAMFSNYRELSSDSKTRTCRAILTLTDEDGETVTVDRDYTIKPHGDKDYSVVLH